MKKLYTNTFFKRLIALTIAITLLTPWTTALISYAQTQENLPTGFYVKQEVGEKVTGYFLDIYTFINLENEEREQYFNSSSLENIIFVHQNKRGSNLQAILHEEVTINNLPILKTEDFSLNGNNISFINKSKSASSADTIIPIVPKFATTIEIIKSPSDPSDNTILIPVKNHTTTREMKANIKDQDGKDMSNIDVLWTITNIEGVTIDAAGKINVTDEAIGIEDNTKLTIKVHVKGNPQIKDEWQIYLKYANPVLTTIEIDGPDYIKIPEEGVQIRYYDIVVKDQYQRSMELNEDQIQEMKWEIENIQELNGISIEAEGAKGKVAIDTSAEEGTKFTVVVDLAGNSAKKTVELSKLPAEPRKIEIQGPEIVFVPAKGEIIEKIYTAIVKDQYEDIIQGMEIDWNIDQEDIEGQQNINIDQNGKLTVTDEIIGISDNSEFKITASLKQNNEIKGELKIKLKYAPSIQNSLSEIEGKDKIVVDRKNLPLEEAYTISVYDQYGIKMTYENVIWELESPTAGITISNGELKITSEANEGEYTINIVAKIKNQQGEELDKKIKQINVEIVDIQTVITVYEAKYTKTSNFYIATILLSTIEGYTIEEVKIGEETLKTDGPDADGKYKYTFDGMLEQEPKAENTFIILKKGNDILPPYKLSTLINNDWENITSGIFLEFTKEYTEKEGIEAQVQLLINGKAVSGVLATMVVTDEGNGSVFQVDQFSTNANGKFDIAFKMPEGIAAGTYHIKLKVAYTDIENTFTFEIV